MRVLVIRYRKLGDALMATPILRALGEQGEVFAVGETALKGVFTGVSCLGGFVGLNGGEPSRWELMRAGLQARRFRCDTALVLRFNRRAAIVARLAGCSVRAGGSRPGWNSLTGLTRNAYDAATWPHNHQVEKYYAVAEAAVGPLPRLPTLYVPEGPVPEGLPPNYVVVHVGNGGSNLAWPDASFAQTVVGLRSRGIAVVVSGAADALGYTQTRAAGDVDLVGRTSLDAIGALFQGARAVVGLDGGGPRMASAVGTPTVVLTLGKKWSRHQASPWMAPGTVLLAPVEPEAVLAAACELLGEG